MEENARFPRRIAVLTVCVLLCLLTVFLLQLQTQKQLTKAQIAYAETLETANSTQADEPVSTTQAKSGSANSDVAAVHSAQAAHRAPVQGQSQKGDSKTEKTTAAPKRSSEISPTLVYSQNAKKLHSPDCPYAEKIKPENLVKIEKEELKAYQERGFALCGYCKGCALR